MEQPRPTRGDRHVPDGLLIIVDCTGIPVLVRPYGDVQQPPSAIVGIISAVFHAAKLDGGSDMQMLTSANRGIVYALGEADILVAFVHNEREDSLKTKIHSSMLRILLRTLQLTIGPSMNELQSGKLRVAISRNLKIIDYFIVHSMSDLSICSGYPVLDFGYSHESDVFSSKYPSLMFAAWLENGIIRHALGSSAALGCASLDLVIILAIAEAHARNKSSSTFVHINKMLKVVSSHDRSWPKGQFVLGIFPSNAQPADIDKFLERATEETVTATLFRKQSVNVGELASLNEHFDQGLLHCIIIPSRPSGLRHAIAITNPAHDATHGGELQEGSLAMLSEFVGARMHCDSSKARTMDYKHEDEVFTLIHCSREPLSIFAIYVGSISTLNVAELGDKLASDVLFMAV